ncbi:MAG: hypothetical protein ABW328_22065, partial [Ilumatobacteraceae bacterium]
PLPHPPRPAGAPPTGDPARPFVTVHPRRAGGADIAPADAEVADEQAEETEGAEGPSGEGGSSGDDAAE